MAVRFTRSANRYVTRTTGLISYNAAYTVLMRIRPIVVNVSNAAIWWIGDGSAFGFYDTLEINGDGTLLIDVKKSGGIQTQSSVATLTAGTEYAIAFVRSSSSQADIYVDGTQVIGATLDVSTRTAAGRQMIGNWAASGDALDARVSGVKMWSRGLSVDEITREGLQFSPRDYNGLYAFYPFLQFGDLTDYGGSGIDWTVVNGPLTTEDNPPIPWGAPLPIMRGVVTAGASAALSGTGLSMTEADVRAGGKQLVIDLTGATFNP